MTSSDSVLLALLSNGQWGPYEAMMDMFRATPYSGQLLEALRSLRRDALYMSHVHGVGHIERTMLHGAMCAAADRLSPADAKLLLQMCSYHDTGRVSDWLDNAHGYRSSLKLAALTGLDGEDLRIAMAGVEAHSLSDKAMEATLTKHAPMDMDRARRLAELLKDADGLDRVRINDLNPRFLRRQDSRERADFAQYLFDQYAALEALNRGDEPEGFDLPTILAVKGFVTGCLDQGRSCTQTALLALGNLTGVIISDQLLDAAAGDSERCGLLEAGLLFLGVYFTRQGLSGADIAPLRREFQQAFLAQYGSDACAKLRVASGGVSCAGFAVDGVLFAFHFLEQKKK